MLSKKRAERQQAIASTAAAERKEELMRMKRRRGESSSGDKERDEKKTRVGERDRAGDRHDEQAPDPLLLSAEDPTSMLRAIGDHVNTRLRELEFDDDLDADLFDEQQRQLREEAALAACTKSRVLAPQVAAFFRMQQEQSRSAPANDSTALTADGVKMIRIGHNSNAVTVVCSLGHDVVVLGDKSGAVYVADLCHDLSSPSSSTSSRKALLSPCLPASVLSIAVSDTRGVRPSQRALFERSTVDTSVTSYIAAGAADGTVSVWVTQTRKHMGFLTMHHAAVTGLTFRHDTLYSCSRDGTLRVWSVPQMICQDKLFGHQGHVLGIHCLRRERCATVGDDGTMRFWKVDVATQQEFAASSHFGVKVILECVTMMSDTIVLCGASNGALLVFDVNRRKPLVVREAAHGHGFVGDGTGLEKLAVAAQQQKDEKHPRTDAGVGQRRQNANPITAVASMPYADVAASASYDGVVRLWRLITPETAKKSNTSADVAKASLTTATATEAEAVAVTTFDCFASIPIDAIVTSLYFPPSCNVLLVGCGKEPRFGRWVVQRHALNAAYVVPLDDTTLRGLASCAHVEHIPAELYGFADDEKEGDTERDEQQDASNTVEDNGNDDGPLNEAADDESDRDGGGEASLFTVGEDGQMQFSVPLEGGVPSERAMASRKKKSKNKQNTTVTSRAADVGGSGKRRLTKGEKKAKTTGQGSKGNRPKNSKKGKKSEGS